MKAGFIGLGHLGKAMVKRLLSEGVEVTVWNRTPGKSADLNVKVASDPAELITQEAVVFLNLFDSAAVRAVLTGEKGLLKGGCRGKIVIDTSTNHFEDVLRFHSLLQEHGAHYLEAPVLGSVIPASQGALTVLVNGNKDAFDTAKPYMEKIGKTIFFLEKPGLAAKMKLINNLALGSFMATLAEAIVFAEEAGISKEEAVNILAAGAGSSLVLNAKREKILMEDFSTHFSSALIYKDLHYLQDLAKTLGRPLFTGSMAKELYGMTYSREMENMDFSAVYKVLKDL